jgi:hypothetical protein
MTAAAPLNARSQFHTHLEFLGYEVEDDGENIMARHKIKLNVILLFLSQGVLHTSLFGCSDHARHYRKDYMELVNALNREATLVRYYANSDLNLMIEGLYMGPYDRSRYGEFLETWDMDAQRMLRKEDLEKFLS